MIEAIVALIKAGFICLSTAAIVGGIVILAATAALGLVAMATYRIAAA